MTRLTAAFIALLCLCPCVFASLSPARDGRLGLQNPPLDLLNRVSQAGTPGGPATGQKGALVITDRTEVKLNGRPCRYQDVPNHAAVILLELAPDQKTVLKVHFRSGK